MRKLAVVLGFAVLIAVAGLLAGPLASDDATAAGTTKGQSMTDFVKPSKVELEETLTPLQYQVTQQSGTERPFDNEYWDNKAPGIYVDVVSGEALFSSTHKYKSGTGWPSFWEMLEPDNVVSTTDYELVYPRTEVRSRNADSHLGHVFEDGPPPTGLRYCLNSASLRFVAVDDLEGEGYGKYLDLFQAAESEAD